MQITLSFKDKFKVFFWSTSPSNLHFEVLHPQNEVTWRCSTHTNFFPTLFCSANIVPDKSPLTGPRKKVPLSGLLHIFPRFQCNNPFLFSALLCSAREETHSEELKKKKKNKSSNGGDTISETNTLQRHRFESQDPTIPHNSTDGSPIRRIRALRHRSPPRYSIKIISLLIENLSGL